MMYSYDGHVIHVYDGDSKANFTPEEVEEMMDLPATGKMRLDGFTTVTKTNHVFLVEERDTEERMVVNPERLQEVLPDD